MWYKYCFSPGVFSSPPGATTSIFVGIHAYWMETGLGPGLEPRLPDEESNVQTIGLLKSLCDISHKKRLILRS